MAAGEATEREAEGDQSEGQEMTGRKLDWDKARWDSFKASAGPSSSGEEINQTEEAKLQAWWDSKKPKPKKWMPKRKKHPQSRAMKAAVSPLAKSAIAQVEHRLRRKSTIESMIKSDNANWERKRAERRALSKPKS